MVAALKYLVEPRGECDRILETVRQYTAALRAEIAEKDIQLAQVFSDLRDSRTNCAGMQAKFSLFILQI